MGHVYYHQPEDKKSSLDFVNPDPQNLVTQIVDYDGDVAVKVMEYDLDTEFYAVYTSRVGGGAVSEIELDLSDALADMTEDNGTIVVRLLEIYRALLSQNEEEEEGTPVEAYKKHEVIIDLPGYELDMYQHEAKMFYVEKHEELWIEFVEQAVESAGFPELVNTAGYLRRSSQRKSGNSTSRLR